MLHLINSWNRINCCANNGLNSTIGAGSLQFTYGYQAKGDNDEMIQLVETVANNFVDSTLPGAYLVDLFPICE